MRTLSEGSDVQTRRPPSMLGLQPVLRERATALPALRSSQEHREGQMTSAGQGALYAEKFQKLLHSAEP